MWTIREATADDLPAIAKIEAQVYTVEGPWSLTDFQTDYALSDRCYLVAEDEGRIIGYAAAFAENDTVDLTMNTVLPEYRKQGIGTQFLIKRLEWAGNRKVVLQTRMDNTTVQQMYAKYGFKPTQVLEDFYPNGVAALEIVREHLTERLPK